MSSYAVCQRPPVLRNLLLLLLSSCVCSHWATCQNPDLRHVTPTKGRRIHRQWLHVVHSFHKELGQHESRSAAELEALKKSNAQADDELGRSVESIVARQAQLRGDVRAQQDSMRSNESAISRLQSEACFCSMSFGGHLIMLLHLRAATRYPHLGTSHVQQSPPKSNSCTDTHAGVAVLLGRGYCVVKQSGDERAGSVYGGGMLQMQGCSINRHLLEEVKEREKGAEAQLERRRKLLDDSNMDADLKRLARESSELAAKASALRKVSTQAP